METQIDMGWRKSSYSGNGGGNCVEVGGHAGHVLVRDTRSRERGHVVLTAGQWRAFVAGLKADR
jgi:hypothetical protein